MAFEVFNGGGVVLEPPCMPKHGPRTFSQQTEKMPPMSGFLHDLAGFDAGAFRISPRIAKDMDPQQRMALEQSIHAIVDGDCSLRLLQEKRTGVYAGAGSVDNMVAHFRNTDNMTPYSMQGSTLGNIANLVSFHLNLKGPSMTLDTACSSSMVALHLANEAILRGEIDAAIVIGTNALLNVEGFIGFAKAKMLSPTGQSRPFHKDADGFVRSEGCVAVLLVSEALADSCTHYARLLARDFARALMQLRRRAPAKQKKRPPPADPLREIQEALDLCRVGAVQQGNPEDRCG